MPDKSNNRSKSSSYASLQSVNDNDVAGSLRSLNSKDTADSSSAQVDISFESESLVNSKSRGNDVDCVIEDRSRSLNEIRRIFARVNKSHANTERFVPSTDYITVIQADTSSLTYHLGTFQDGLDGIDNIAYNQTDSCTALSTLLSAIVAVDNMTEQGREFVQMLYAYRSLSRSISNIRDDYDHDDRGSTNEDEIERRIVEILRPEIRKLHDLQAFVLKAVEMFRTCLMKVYLSDDFSFSSSSLINGIQSESLWQSLSKLLDILMQIDILKHLKRDSLLADFLQYKVSVSNAGSGSYGGRRANSDSETTSLEQFLNHTDVQRRDHIVFALLRDEILRFMDTSDSNPVESLLDVLMVVVGALQNQLYVSPDEKFSFLRVVPYLILLIDSLSEDEQVIRMSAAKGTAKTTKMSWMTSMGRNIFSAPTQFLEPLQYVVSQYPCVPCFPDYTLNVLTVLERSPRFLSKMAAAWGAKPDERVISNYDIEVNWEQMRGDFGTCVTLFTLFCGQLDHAASDKNMDIAALASKAFEFVRQGTSYVLQWSCLLRQALAWKYAHPVTASRLQAMGINSLENVSEYERTMRYNVSADMMNVMADVISMIKALVQLLQQAEMKLAPLLRIFCHQYVQNLIQSELLPLTHRVDKRKNADMLPILLQIRALAADWINDEEPLENYKLHKRKFGVVASDFPLRSVSLSATQLKLLRSYVRSIYLDTSTSKLRYGVMGRKTDLEPSDLAILDKFYQTSRFFPVILAYSSALSDMSNLSYMWYRECFLDKAKAIQFPIDMSLPWMLTQHVIASKNVQSEDVPLLEKFLYIVDVYNDAAQTALYAYGVQHLYNEIEAETNLVLDQLVFLLSDDVYNYYKNSAALIAMEKGFRDKLEELKGSPYLTLTKRRFDIPLAQRNVHILGRSVNLTYLMGRHLNDKLRRDLDCALVRFESGSVCALPELQMTLSIISSVHEQLSQYLDLDSFSDMLADVNETFAPSSAVTHRGRIATHVIYSVMCDILPNYTYNYYTQRFVQSPNPVHSCAYGRAPKRAALEELLGSMCAKAFERAGSLTRGFFGRAHMEAMLLLLGYLEIPRLVDECLQIIVDKMQDLTAYVDALADHLLACHLPYSCAKSAEHAYYYFHSRTAHLLEFDDLKPEVFQTLRYIGNALAFFKDLSSVLEVFDQFEFMSVAPLLGQVPDTNLRKPESSVSHSPFVKVLRNLSGVGTSSARRNTASYDDPQHSKKGVEESLVDAFLVQQLPGMAQRAIEVLSSSLGSHNLFEGFLGRFHSLFVRLGLHEAWELKAHNEVDVNYDKNSILAANGFHRLWAALLFLFCEQKFESGYVGSHADKPYFSNEDEFGHGFYFAGAFFRHIMAHRTDYCDADYCETVLRVHLECAAKEKVDTKHFLESDSADEDAGNESADASALPLPISLFVDNAAISRQLLYDMQICFFTLSERAKNAFNAHDESVTAESVHGGARHVIRLFHPPREIPNES